MLLSSQGQKPFTVHEYSKSKIAYISIGIFIYNGWDYEVTFMSQPKRVQCFIWENVKKVRIAIKFGWFSEIFYKTMD